jgi:hypothetical protein
MTRECYVRLSFVSVSLLPVTLSSCGDPLPIQYETEHLRIGSALAHPMCGGDLAHYEKIIATVESELVVDLDRQIDIFTWSEGEWKEHVSH